jgi:hypothetical protein
MNGEEAQTLFNSMLEYLRKNYHRERVNPGAFGEYMNVEIVADGPVTLIIDSVKDEKAQRKLAAQKEREAKQEAKKKGGAAAAQVGAASIEEVQTK